MGIYKEGHSNNHELNYLISFLSAGLLMVSNGNVVSWPSPTIPHLQGHNSPLKITNSEAAAIGYIFYLGTIFGVTLVWPLLNYVGRKTSLLVSGSLYSASWMVLFCTQYSVWVIYFARFLAGMAQVLSMCMAPVYMVEISKVKWRQAVGNALQFFINVGLMIQYSIGSWTDYWTLLYINLGISLSFLVLFTTVATETPMCLAMHGHYDKAKEVLQYYRGSENINEEFIIIQSQIKDTNSLTILQQAKAIMKEPSYRNTLFLLLGLTYFFVFSGVSQLIAFTETVFRVSEVKISPRMSSLSVGGAKLVGGLALPFLVKRFGIKIMIIVSAFISGVSMFFLGLHFYLRSIGYRLHHFQWLPLSSMMTYFFFVTIGVSFMAQYLRAEMFATRIKALGIAIQEMVTCIMLEICSLVFTAFLMGPGKHSNVENDQQNIPQAPYIPIWIFSSSLLLAVPFVAFLIPDTKNMNLQQIQDWLSPKKKRPNHV